MRRLVKFAAATMISGGLGLAGFATASGPAQAVVGAVPDYHWCPGDSWHPEWGGNWDGGACHDDFHRDMDGNDHTRDFGGQDRYWRPFWQQ